MRDIGEERRQGPGPAPPRPGGPTGFGPI